MVEPERLKIFKPRVADREALFLIFCWVASLLFPLFPVINPYVFARKLGVFAHSPVFDPMPLLTAFSGWFAAGSLTKTLWVRRWTGALLLTIPIQFFINGQQPLLSELLGAVAGLMLAIQCPPSRAASRAAAVGFLIVLTIRGLSPFHFTSVPASFSWIPFAGVLTGDWQSALLTLIGKMFYYGAAIWLLHAAGLRWRSSAALVALVLAGIEIAQTQLPGRTPESMDPILAILLGFILVTLSRGTETRSRSTG
jgi:hypothetical protein